MLISLSRSSNRAMAWTTIVSTLSGENLSLYLQRGKVKPLVGSTPDSPYRDKEWLRPRLMVARSLGSSPSSKEASCSLIPRNRSLFPRFSGLVIACTLILSFLDIERPARKVVPSINKEMYVTGEPLHERTYPACCPRRREFVCPCPSPRFLPTRIFSNPFRFSLLESR